MSLISKAFAQQVDYSSYNRAIGLKAELYNNTLGGIVSYFLPYVLTLAGMILFGMLVAGGFSMLAGAADKEAQEKGKHMITNAFMGFIIIFLAYWIAQILQVIFKVSIVN
ncbi:MAG: hypothetical protein WCL07_02950 [bacterium]